MNKRTHIITIPEQGPIVFARVESVSFEDLQALVGGYISSVPCPDFIEGSSHTSLFINDEGKFTCRPNMAATDFMVPGVGLFFGDFIAGPMVIVGFDPETGEDAHEIPQGVIDRVLLIADESGRGRKTVADMQSMMALALA